MKTSCQAHLHKVEWVTKMTILKQVWEKDTFFSWSSSKRAVLARCKRWMALTSVCSMPNFLPTTAWGIFPLNATISLICTHSIPTNFQPTTFTKAFVSAFFWQMKKKQSKENDLHQETCRENTWQKLHRMAGGFPQAYRPWRRRAI